MYLAIHPVQISSFSVLNPIGVENEHAFMKTRVKTRNFSKLLSNWLKVVYDVSCFTLFAVYLYKQSVTAFAQTSGDPITPKGLFDSGSNHFFRTFERCPGGSDLKR